MQTKRAHDNDDDIDVDDDGDSWPPSSSSSSYCIYICKRRAGRCGFQQVGTTTDNIPVLDGDSDDEAHSSHQHFVESYVLCFTHSHTTASRQVSLGLPIAVARPLFCARRLFQQIYHTINNCSRARNLTQTGATAASEEEEKVEVVLVMLMVVVVAEADGCGNVMMLTTTTSIRSAHTHTHNDMQRLDRFSDGVGRGSRA